jgi:hypothetical protein
MWKKAFEVDMLDDRCNAGDFFHYAVYRDGHLQRDNLG